MKLLDAPSSEYLTTSTHPKYRPDIDGLRAIAVLSVVAYHAFPDWVKGGFVGVDIFFVISGFLISSIILSGLKLGGFSFSEFYSRRVMRIFPALLLVMCASFVFGWFTLLPKEYAELGKHIAGGAGFISNFLLWSESGYFDSPTQLKPLLHLWSLGVEEQFYIVWPPLLFIAWKKRYNLLSITLLVLFASLYLNVSTVHQDATGTFYSPITRFWELLIGSTLAYITLYKNKILTNLESKLDSVLGAIIYADIPVQAGKALADSKSFAGLALIAFAIYKINTGFSFPGWWAIFPVVGAFLLISAGPTAFINRTVLSNRILVFFGLISYPLYLWHWPILVFTRFATSGKPPIEALGAAVSLSIVLALVTYRFIEKPIRNGKRPTEKTVGLVVLMIAVGYIGLDSYQREGLPFRFGKTIRRYANFTYDPLSDSRRDSCWLSNNAAPGGYSDTCVDKPVGNLPLVFLWGDSHAARLYPGLVLSNKNQFRLAQFTRDSCPPISDFSYENCIKSFPIVLDKVREMRPDVVVLFAVWNDYTETSKIDIRRLNGTIQQLNEIGIPKIVVMGPAPKWDISLPYNLAKIYQQDFSHKIPARTTIGLDPSSEKIDGVLQRQLEGQKNVKYFSSFKAFCDQQGCLTRTSDDPESLTTYDYGHLTTAGAKYLSQKLMAETNNFGTAK